MSMSKHAKNSVFSWCHSVTRLFFVKAKTCFSYSNVGYGTGMDPCTLSSIQFFTEDVLILSPCPRTPESCQNLLVVVVNKAHARAQVFALFSRARLDQFDHLSAVFLAAYAASYRDISHYSWYHCNEFCFSFVSLLQDVRSMMLSPL